MNLPLKFERRPGRSEAFLVAVGMALALMLAWVSPFGRWTAIFSFDAITVFLPDPVPEDVVIIYLDEQSHDVLQQPYDGTWDRRLHARLIDRLGLDGARLIYFDIVFEKPSPDPAHDLAFADAIHRHGSVVLGASVAVTQEAEGIQRRVIAPLARLRQAARAWGSLSFLPLDGDHGVRQVPDRIQDVDHAAVHAARLLQGEIGDPPHPVSPGWIHYFGPPGAFAAVSYHQALAPDGVPPGFFKGRVVLVGAKYSTGYSGSGKDSFVTPFSRFEFPPMPGTEVNANLLTTLRFNRTLRRLSPTFEIVLLLGVSLAFTRVLLGLRPASATFAVLSAIVLSATMAWVAGARLKLWGNWFLFAGGAAPVALVISVGRNYYIERTRREKVTRAFEKYLSPEMVRQASVSAVDIKPGGTTRGVTAMMTDIEGFSAVAENMSEEEVSGMLIAYYSELTQHVFEHQGTVIQFVGDAIYCVWGAPLDQPAQTDLALRAAMAIRASMHGKTFNNHALRTRIGISTGNALCGNLGSARRFDYAVIGDNTNLAARIEGANKRLGTLILLSDSTKKALRGQWVLRDVGDFLVAGRVQPVRLWEPIAEGVTVPAFWAEILQAFASGLAAWRGGEWQEAEKCFQAAVNLGGTSGDGPSAFYLKMPSEDQVRMRRGPITL